MEVAKVENHFLKDAAHKNQYFSLVAHASSFLDEINLDTQTVELRTNLLKSYLHTPPL